MDPDISSVAGLIGDSTRAQILWALMGGLALPAGELARSANVAPQTASAHLSKLLGAKLLSAEVQGRHRYYRLAGPEIAAILESLGSGGAPNEGNDAAENLSERSSSLCPHVLQPLCGHPRSSNQ